MKYLFTAYRPPVSPLRLSSQKGRKVHVGSNAMLGHRKVGAMSGFMKPAAGIGHSRAGRPR